MRSAVSFAAVFALAALSAFAQDAKPTRNPKRVDYRKIEREIQARNAARIDKGGRVSLVVLGEDVRKDRRTSPDNVVDGNVHSRQVMTGAPYRFRIELAVAACVVAVAPAVPAPADEKPAAKNIVFNGSFEADADGDGTADGWSFSGDPRGLTVKLTREAGREGGKSQRMTCSRYERVSGWTHVMLCQLDKVKVRKRHLYTVSFWAKAEDIKDVAVGVGLQDTKGWHALGLSSSFVPTARWERFELQFVAERDCAAGSRFQIWFNSTGTLWVDDVKIVEHPPRYGAGPRRPARPLRSLPNASFELGPAGWGSESRYYYGWGTPMNRLFGQVVEVTDAPHGRRCLRIDLNDRTRPVAYFDYFMAVRHAIQAPLAGNLGFIELKPGSPHVASAWLRADAEATPVLLGVHYLDGWFQTSRLSVGRKWRRHSFAFRAQRAAGYVVVGPDLKDSQRPECTLWVDAVQIEQAKAAGEFARPPTFEVALATQRPGNVFFDGEKPQLIVSVAAPAGEARGAAVTVRITDFRDNVVSEKVVPLEVLPGKTLRSPAVLGLKGRGFWRVRAMGKDVRVVNDLRVAVVAKVKRTDSVIGINHAYGWDHLTRPCVQAGIGWARDWSLNWQQVEPVKGRFDFTGAEHQIGRALRLGHSVLGLLPFPSSNWSSEAPASVKVTKAYPGNRRRMWYAPRDVGEFKSYVSACVKNFRGRIKWWQCFNEPLYTNYSLPRKSGYKPADYARLVKAFHQAAKAADLDCKVLAGPGGWTSGSAADLKGMLAAGMGAYCDAIDLHTYPGMKPPEALERDLAKINEILAAAKVRKPLWLTEHGYYADDDLMVVPPKQGFIKPLTDERQQAEYSIRFNLFLLAAGVRKIFYHAGSCGGLNADSLQSVFFRYGGEPRKILPAVAAFAELFGPQTQFVRDVSKDGEYRALLFRDGKRLILAAWQPRAGRRIAVSAVAKGVAIRDMMGNPIGGEAVLSTSPVFAVADGVDEKAFIRGVKILP